MTQPGKNFRPHHAAFCAAVALICCACPQVGHSEPPVKKTNVDITSDDSIQVGIRNGSLAYAVAPLSEDALNRLDGTPHDQSVTFPLIVDRANNEFLVEAKLNGKTVRLMFDTGGGPDITLDDADAKGAVLTSKAVVESFGVQGTESEPVGLADSLTLGRLALRNVVVTTSHNAPYSMLGILVLKKYRITLNLAAQTMTLTRGGVLKAPYGGASLTLPFDDDNGKIFVPVHVMSQDGWAALDSGSDLNEISLKAAKTAATQLPASDVKMMTMTGRIGGGNTMPKIVYVTLKVPVPISLNDDHAPGAFSTTSQIGLSNIDDLMDAEFGAGGNMNAKLGFPFFAQFERVIIDYPAHTLVLQYPVKDTPLKVEDFSTKHDRAWPGYKWLQKGYGWIEVPDGKEPTPPPAANAPAQTAGTATVSGGTVVTMGNGSVTVMINGVTKVYPAPPGSGITVNPDGSVHISPPPTSTNAAGQTGGT